MSDSLRALVIRTQVLEESLLENNGELTPELELELTNLDVKLPAKIDGYAMMIERLDMYEDYWKDKAKQLQAIARGCANARERMKDALKLAAEQLQTDELLGEDSRFKISNSKPRLIVDRLQLTDDYLTETVIYEPDTNKISEDMKAGKEVPGAKFEETKSIRIYANKRGMK